MLKVDESEEKISLGMKQTEQDPWMIAAAQVPGRHPDHRQGAQPDVSFGAFVEIEPGIDGLIHISDMSWTKRVQHPSEVVKKGDAVDVVILNIDADNKRISLGLKQAEEDPWLTIGETLPGRAPRCAARVIRLMDKGVVVDLGNDIEGFAPMSQLGVADRSRIPSDAVKAGQQVVTQGARGRPDPSPDRGGGHRVSRPTAFRSRARFRWRRSSPPEDDDTEGYEQYKELANKPIE